MSGLVTYDSSSEDEQSSLPEQDPPRVDQIEVAASTTSIAAPIGQSTANLVSTHIDGPLQGPSFLRDHAESYNTFEEEDSTAELSGMSERDVIRHLTQPTHPMTEMPPSPPTSPDAKATARLRKFLELKRKGVHFNDDLAQKGAYKNPSLLVTLMQRNGIDEEHQYLTSLPTDVFDTSMFPASAYKEALLKSQQSIRSEVEAKKKVRSAAGTRTIEFTAARSSPVGSRDSTPGQSVKRRRA